MKTLLILRHAKSSWKHPELADHDRPLSKRGKRDAPRMGKLLQEIGLVPEMILSSTARRARDTATLLIEACNYHGEIDLLRDLYMADPEDILDVLRNLPDDLQIVMLVGHNPDLEDLLELLTEEYASLTTATLAQVELDLQHWYELSEEVKGELRNLWRPRHPA